MDRSYGNLGLSRRGVSFGLQLSSITPDLRAKYKLDPKQEGVVVTAVALGSEAGDLDIDAGRVIMRVRDTPVSSPEDVLKSVRAERQDKHAFVPMLITGAGGPTWVPFTLH